MGNSPFGTTSGILDSGSDQVLNFRANNYGAESVIVVGTGNVDHDALCAAAEGLTAVSTLILTQNSKYDSYDMNHIPLGWSRFKPRSKMSIHWFSHARQK